MYSIRFIYTLEDRNACMQIEKWNIKTKQETNCWIISICFETITEKKEKRDKRSRERKKANKKKIRA